MPGIIHIGAHKGEEVADYIAAGLSPILLFEPQQLNWTPPPEATLIRIALGKSNGTLSLHVPHHLHETSERDTESASGFRVIPEQARSIGWTPLPDDKFDSLEAPMMRFDDWARKNSRQFRPEDYSLLAIDVQGMELDVLIGMGELLRGIEEAIIECSQPSVYDGAAPALEVIEYLRNFGLYRATPVLPHGDISFRRKIDGGSFLF